MLTQAALNVAGAQFVRLVVSSSCRPSRSLIVAATTLRLGSSLPFGATPVRVALTSRDLL